MEIAQLKADKERLERELKALEGESPYVPTDKNGLQSLHDLIDQERRKFKKALADERARSAEALDKQRAEMQEQLRELKWKTRQEETRALTESSIMRDPNAEPANQRLLQEVKNLRNTLSQERQHAETTFQELREELTLLRRQASSKTDSSSVVRAWGMSSSINDTMDGKISRLESSLAAVTEERDLWRRRENEARREMRATRDSSLGSSSASTQPLAAQLSQSLREKERVLEELREYEEEAEKFRSQREDLQQKVSTLISEKAELHATISRLQGESMGGKEVMRGEAETLRGELREKERALVKLQKEHKRLQIMAAGRSPAAQRKPAGF